MPSFMDTLNSPWRSMPMVPFLSPFSTTSQQPGSRSFDTIFASRPASFLNYSLTFLFYIYPSYFPLFT